MFTDENCSAKSCAEVGWLDTVGKNQWRYHITHKCSSQPHCIPLVTSLPSPLLHQPPTVVTRILGEFGDLDTIAPTYTEEEAAIMLQVGLLSSWGRTPSVCNLLLYVSTPVHKCPPSRYMNCGSVYHILPYSFCCSSPPFELIFRSSFNTHRRRLGDVGGVSAWLVLCWRRW